MKEGALDCESISNHRGVAWVALGQTALPVIPRVRTQFVDARKQRVVEVEDDQNVLRSVGFGQLSGCRGNRIERG